MVSQKEPLETASGRFLQANRPSSQPSNSVKPLERYQQTQQLTVFNLADVTDDDVADRNLDNFAAAHCRKPVLVLDLVLQTAELSLLAPVVE